MFIFALAFFRSGLSGGFFYAVLVVIAGCLLWATLAGRDLWPFSHYPMFGNATDATAVRFFRLRVHLENGRPIGLAGAANALVDPFHREFERLWETGSIAPAAADEIVLRCWREACRLEGKLAPAQRVEVIGRFASLIRGGEIVVMEKVVHAVTTSSHSAVA